MKPDGGSVIIPFTAFKDGVCAYDPCYPGCLHQDKRLDGYHADCVRHKGCLSVPNLVAATSYSYEPWPGENVRRLRWVRSRLATIIYLSLARRLPYDLSYIVACYCVREYALQTSTKFFQNNSAADFRIELSKPVRARYASLDGVSYIVSLANEPSSGNVVPISLSGAPIRAVFVAEDHLGVREVLFTGPSGMVQGHPRPGLWWRTVRVDGHELEGQTDVSNTNHAPSSFAHRGRVLNYAVWFVQSRAIPPNAACFGPHPSPIQNDFKLQS